MNNDTTNIQSEPEFPIVPFPDLDCRHWGETPQKSACSKEAEQ